MTILLNWKHSRQFSGAENEGIGPQNGHAYSNPRSTQSVIKASFLLETEAKGKDCLIY